MDEDRVKSSIAQPKWIDIDSSQDGKSGGGVDVDDGDDMDGKKTVVPSFVSVLVAHVVACLVCCWSCWYCNDGAPGRGQCFCYTCLW